MTQNSKKKIAQYSRISKLSLITKLYVKSSEGFKKGRHVENYTNCKQGNYFCGKGVERL